VLTLSQVIFGVGDLDAATRRFSLLGFEVLDGGVHPGVGTANRVIPLGAQYIELLGVASPADANKNEYGRSLLRAIEHGDRLVRWSLRTDVIEDVASRLGLGVEHRRRERPDGQILTWRAAGLDLALADSTLPFFMEWDRAEQYPGLMGAPHPNGARRVSSLSITPLDPDRFRTWTAGADAPTRLGSASSPGIWSVGVDTDDGELLLRA
jgi:Glyoxalase-like domain